MLLVWPCSSLLRLRLVCRWRIPKKGVVGALPGREWLVRYGRTAASPPMQWPVSANVRRKPPRTAAVETSYRPGAP